MQYDTLILKIKKPEFDLIEGEVLTIKMEVSLGTRGHFSMVLPVRCCGSSHLVARYQGVPKPPHFCRCDAKSQVVLLGSSANAEVTQPLVPSRVREPDMRRMVLLYGVWSQVTMSPEGE
jgi:hypothetical protein